MLPHDSPESHRGYQGPHKEHEWTLRGSFYKSHHHITFNLLTVGRGAHNVGGARHFNRVSVITLCKANLRWCQSLLAIQAKKGGSGVQEATTQVIEFYRAEENWRSNRSTSE